jgi:hypothetical protein
MVVALTVLKDDVSRLSVTLHLTGLVVGTRYDLMRLQVRYVGDNDLGVPVYDRELPDRAALWSTVAHRVSWQATATTADVTDYECPMRPTQWFIVESSLVGPAEYEGWDKAPYPVSRGVLSPTIVHFNREYADLMGAGAREQGHVLVRSTVELGKYVSCCVVDIDELKYVARGTELAVIGSQYPVFISDTREARRGSIILKVDTLGAYNDLRSIVFPPGGAVRPVIFNAGSEPTMLLDDMRVIPLDIGIEQVTHSDPSSRYVHIDFTETDPTVPLIFRTGDNDTLVSKPTANFTISDTTPARNQWITLTDTSSGSFDSYDWSVGTTANNAMSKYYSKGPFRIAYKARGTFVVKLRVYGLAGASTVTKTITVH